ncbi:type I-E CRISPR-associated protein Cse1/CasA [Rothia kristinae]|uniref:type I-E CRISPR-associated protein Cse1/CasA n=1 Tax=Rothia kristinae TaxID=37923 RepID=UPI0022E79638|nr:type I-E CRISPR-associated protein Cse1/CasA [Rothia kristinae]
MTSSFNLLDEPWIQCAVGEERRELSLREVFQNLCSIRRLAGDSPTQDYAILRVLLAIFWRAHRKHPLLTGARKQTRRWWTAMFLAATEGGEEELAELTQPVLAYLKEHRDRFDLLDPNQPFMQVADLHTVKGEYKSPRELIPDGKYDYFNRRAGRSLEELDFAESTRLLIALHSWDFSGKKSGAIGGPPVSSNGTTAPIGPGSCGRTGGVILHGDQLAQTLMLNTPAGDVFGRHTEEDLPVWEQEPQGAASRGVEHPAGPADVLTWQTRRVRLFPEEGRVTSVLVSNGDRIEQKNQFADPMTGYRWSSKKSTKDTVVYMPATHSAQRTLWRGVQALLVREGAMAPKKGEHLSRQPKTIAALRDLIGTEVPGLAETQIRVELVGMVYGTQNAVIEESIHEEIPLRLGMLMESSPRLATMVIEAADATMRAAESLGQFAGNLLRAAGGDYEFQEHVTEGVLQRLGDRFRLWLEGLHSGVDRETSRDAWFDIVEKFVKQEAAALCHTAGPKALIGKIVEDSKTGKEWLLTSATALAMLRGSLRKNLPRFRNQERAAQTQTNTAAPDPQQIGATA